MNNANQAYRDRLARYEREQKKAEAKNEPLPTSSPQIAEKQITDFLAILSALSVEHGIAIAGEPELFTMEREDYERSYKANDESKLIFE